MKFFEGMSVITYCVSKIIPKKKNRWIFGAWFGKNVSDNPYAICKYLKQEYPEIEIIWVTNDCERCRLEGWKSVKRNSVESLKYILTAEVAIMNQGFGDFNAFNCLGGVYKVQLWHGVAWKKIVGDALPEVRNWKDKLYRNLFFFINHYDLYIAPSDIYADTLKSAFKARESEIMKVGQPRNALLFDENKCKKIRADFLKSNGLPDKKILVYMPTFRDGSVERFSFGQKDVQMKIREIAQRYNFVIVEKSHFEDSWKDSNEGKGSECVFFTPNEPADVMLAVADLLITDYSSCFFDFLIRNKPIIHFAYDYEYYRDKDRGLYYEIDEVASGNVAYTFEDLCDFIKNNMLDPNCMEGRRIEVRQKYIKYESCDVLKQIIHRIFSDIKK